MPRIKKTSTVLEKTEQRLIGLRAINSDLKINDTISVDRLSQLTGQLRNQLNHYNLLLTEIDTAKADMETLEQTIRETSERLVSGVASIYGKDSREYEMAGGVRKSDRARKANLTRLKSTPADTKSNPVKQPA
jgi:hypothetical protein